MPRLTIFQARSLWSSAIATRGWKGRIIEQVMFDWPDGNLTRYHPNPPAFHSISDEHDTVDEQVYCKLQAEILLCGERFSNLGSAQKSGASIACPLTCIPAPLTSSEIHQAIRIVMKTIHPAVVRQEQILRCAFIAQLSEETRNIIGTLSANIHPEMPTPSGTYQRKGLKTRRARIDLGFGHPTRCEETIGAIELKTLSQFGETWFRKQLERLNLTSPGLMFSGLAGDFQKLLDPKLPNSSFRYSWAITTRRGSATPEEIARWAESLMEPVKRRLSLGNFERSYHSEPESLSWKWPTGTSMNLLWYWPKKGSPDHFEPVWTTPS
jgi:hypothetical protein